MNENKSGKSKINTVDSKTLLFSYFRCVHTELGHVNPTAGRCNG